jgi:leader peptidase (prepilin peptidase)/N-methyltransferase
MITALAGYGFFWITNKIFYFLRKHDGLGQGDLELIAMIGAFLGAIGCWSTILFASLFGTVCGCGYMLWEKKPVTVLPFGPFLALGACMFVLYQSEILQYLQLHV